MIEKKWNITKSSVLIDRFPWIILSEQDVVLPNGIQIDGYITWEEREYALVVALAEDGIPMVQQYKHGTHSFSLDLPGGYLNENEKPLECAKRELLEETGLVADNWIHLSSLFLDNNRGNAKAHLFLASNAKIICPPSLDDTEDLEVIFYSYTQLHDLIYTELFDSLPTMTALLLAFNKIDNIK